MNGCETSKPYSRPQTPEKVLWFEFLLNPSLLEEHLRESSPTAGELICHFLANATPATQQASQTETPGCVTPVDSPLSEASPSHANSVKDESVPSQERKKVLALKLLAIRVATFLRWDLTHLQKILPLHMQSLLLLELKKVVGLPEDEVPESWYSMTPEARFAYTLFCRWVIQTLTNNSYPVRQPKGLTVQIPGQSDVMTCAPEATEMIMAKVHESCMHCEEMLDKLLVDRPSVIIPLSECIGTITEENLMPNHRWDAGLVLNEDDIICQVSYDLGCLAFFQENYSKAQTLFKWSNDIYPNLKQPVFSTVDRAKLEGFYVACESIVGPTTTNPEMHLKSELSSTTMNSTEIVRILLEDNLRREMSIPFRDNVELQILREKPRSELYTKIVIVNSIRRCVEGLVVLTNLSSVLTLSTMNFFCDAVCAAGEQLTGLPKLYLKQFVQLQKHYSKELSEIMDQSQISKIFFSDDERLTSKERKNILGIPRDLSFTSDTEAVISRLERDLISTRHAGDVRLLLQQLKNLTGKLTLCSLNAGWEIPRPLQGLVKGLPSGLDQDYICILLAKALELRTAKCYEESCIMFKEIEREIGKLAPQLSSAIGWELLHMDLLQFSSDPDGYSPAKKQFILQKAKSCIASVADGQDISPKPELLELSAHILFNWQEWEPLCNLEGRKGSALDFTKQLAVLCRDVRSQKGARATARNFWSTMLSIFSVSGGGPYKRTIGSKEIRDTGSGNPSKTAIINFIKGLKDSFVLTLTISCLTKLHNILKDDSNLEIFQEHQNLWPAVLSNASQFNISSVAEVLQIVLQHALSVIPTHVLWTKIHGDLFYIQGHHAAALGTYLAAAIEASSYFSLPLPKVPFDDALFRRMIHCCSRLQCYTQAALLCQCLEEPNYTQAFKSLSERACSDSSDAYYSYIWDVTLLEFLINLHARRGETERCNLAQRLMGVLELNANNNDEVQREAANIRKAQFLRAIAKQYL